MKQGTGGRTGEGKGAVDGEDTGMATNIAELAVGVTGEDLAAIAAEELDGAPGGNGLDGDIVKGTKRSTRRRRRGGERGYHHASLLFFQVQFGSLWLVNR